MVEFSQWRKSDELLVSVFFTVPDATDQGVLKISVDQDQIIDGRIVVRSIEQSPNSEGRKWLAERLPGPARRSTFALMTVVVAGSGLVGLILPFGLYGKMKRERAWLSAHSVAYERAVSESSDPAEKTLTKLPWNAPPAFMTKHDLPPYPSSTGPLNWWGFLAISLFGWATAYAAVLTIDVLTALR